MADTESRETEASNATREESAPDSSPLSVRLGGSEPPPPTQTPDSERKLLAEKRVGAQLKSWRLTKLLGVGPITATYEAARGAKDAKERAIVKCMIGSLASHDRAKSLFLRAAYAANRFNHARVLPILEDGVDEEGAPFVVRPWVEAEPFDTVVERDPPDERHALRFAEQILDALEMAHAHGIVHGALTPSNILVTPRGSIRLCDFATPPGVGATRASDDDLLAQLRAGPYAAPERLTERGATANESTDVYAVGACLYFALARKAPERGEHGRVRPVRELAPVGEAFAAVIDHALKPDPVARYESAYAMLGDVRRVMVGRKPKLGDAISPVPSQSMTDIPVHGPPSSRRVPSSSMRDMPRSGSLSVSSQRTQRRRETRGNFMLVLAIAVLVGTATFVLVREKMNDAREPHKTHTEDNER